MKKVFKYGTGQEIPEGAVYLNTVTQTKLPNIIIDIDKEERGSVDCWLVWHYFLLEVDE